MRRNLTHKAVILGRAKSKMVKYGEGKGKIGKTKMEERNNTDRKDDKQREELKRSGEYNEEVGKKKEKCHKRKTSFE